MGEIPPDVLAILKKMDDGLTIAQRAIEMLSEQLKEKDHVVNALKQELQRRSMPAYKSGDEDTDTGAHLLWELAAPEIGGRLGYLGPLHRPEDN